MTDYELLARLHQLSNHCQACDLQISQGLSIGQLGSDIEKYAVFCTQSFYLIQERARSLADQPLYHRIEEELLSLKPLIAWFMIQCPASRKCMEIPSVAGSILSDAE